LQLYHLADLGFDNFGFWSLRSQIYP